ncbi:hypothetical protein N7U66_20520 [Lacinutrix neustonica]|uniref:Uncharacterized protein n=1 Tax=Lacinutrix neustonica TaxID=2980107 RepID=A0A9E8MV43_9FLAO|nr:hypothetical protein [Lacinutrix neustonica]WAC02128.1 hypothetical protein N7U66_20520 [Lacinutrix neustonica]
MKKIILFTIILIIINSCCNGDEDVSINTIESARGFIYSYDENGIYPYLDEFNPNELGIGVFADSITNRIELGDGCGQTDVIYTNNIDSLNVMTIYDFNDIYLAGSNVNDILLGQDDLGGSYPTIINNNSSVSHTYKFSVVPENDSLQFEISRKNN